MPAAEPDAIVATRLAAELGSPWVVGTNVFRGPMRPVGTGVPELALFALATGGPAPEPYLGGADAGDLSRKAVQVTVRGTPRSRAAAATLARAVRDALHKAPLTGYVECLAQQSEPNYVHQDEGDRSIFTVNVLLVLSE